MSGSGWGEGGFLVEHRVVGAAARGDAARAQVDEEGEGGGDEAGDGERGKRFIQSADHDTAFVAPCRRCAAVSEKGTDIPRQEGKANDPEGGVDGVDGEIDFRREGA